MRYSKGYAPYNLIFLTIVTSELLLANKTSPKNKGREEVKG